MKILYVEDDPTARQYIRKGLEEHGNVVQTASDGDEGLEAALGESFDLVILDVGLPAADGFEVLERMRRAGVRTPVLCLSARGDVADRVRGLRLGADDYLPKPFAFAELLARIQAIARRTLPSPTVDVLRVADLELDLRRCLVRRGGTPIDLTRKEYALLEYLMRHSDQVLSRTMITEQIWGYSFDRHSNVIDVHIAHLRRKIDRDFDRKLLRTVKGFGYALEDPGERASARDPRGSRCARR
jgi:DNA-binding response OmpR family regulator